MQHVAIHGDAAVFSSLRVPEGGRGREAQHIDGSRALSRAEPGSRRIRTLRTRVRRGAPCTTSLGAHVQHGWTYPDPCSEWVRQRTTHRASGPVSNRSLVHDASERYVHVQGRQGVLCTTSLGALVSTTGLDAP